MSDIQTNNVSYIIPGTEKLLLEKINLSVEKNETLTIVGLGGSGKTALIKIMAGLIEPTAGEVFIDNINVTKAARQQIYGIRQRMGFMFQNAALISNLSVYDNVALPLRYHTALSEEEITDKTAPWFDMAGLKKNIHDFPAELNISQRKITGLIRAAVNSPEYIFLDEPVSNLDFIYKNLIKQILRRFKNDKTTIVMTTNDIKWASEISDRYAVIGGGNVEFNGTYDNMYSGGNKKVTEIIKHIGE